MSRLLIGAALAAFTMGAGGAAQAETYPVTGVDIVGAAAQIHVITENRNDIAVDVSPSRRLPSPTMTVTNGRLVIDGGLARRIHGCMSISLLGQGETNVNVWGAGRVPQHELPVITLRVPRQLDISAGGALFGDIGASSGGKTHLGGCGHIAIGPASGAFDVVQSGSGDLDLANVSGALRVRLDGSGDVRVVSAGAGVQAELIGSGDLNVGPVSGQLTARLDGSGDLRVMGGASGANLDLNGSGDIAIGAVSGSLRAHVDGSGDLNVASLAGGQAELILAGSGGLGVNGGAADHLSARLDGSGDIRFRGRAGALDADLGGSGDIFVAEAGQSQIHDHGSGDVRIGR